MIVVSFICCIQPAVRHHCRGRVGKRQDILRIETRHHIVLAVKDCEILGPAYLHGRLVIRKRQKRTYLYIGHHRVLRPVVPAEPYPEGRVVIPVPSERRDLTVELHSLTSNNSFTLAKNSSSVYFPKSFITLL